MVFFLFHCGKLVGKYSCSFTSVKSPWTKKILHWTPPARIIVSLCFLLGTDNVPQILKEIWIAVYLIMIARYFCCFVENEMHNLSEKRRLFLANLESGWKDLQQAHALLAAQPGNVIGKYRNKVWSVLDISLRYIGPSYFSLSSLSSLSLKGSEKHFLALRFHTGWCPLRCWRDQCPPRWSQPRSRGKLPVMQTHHHCLLWPPCCCWPIISPQHRLFLHWNASLDHPLVHTMLYTFAGSLALTIHGCQDVLWYHYD